MTSSGRIGGPETILLESMALRGGEFNSGVDSDHGSDFELIYH